MFKRCLVAIVSLFIILCALHSCKKDSSSPITHTITYKLTASNYAVFNNISYTDTIGVQSVTSAVDSTSGWSKTITRIILRFYCAVTGTGAKFFIIRTYIQT